MTFFEVWKSYRQRVLPPTAGSVQVLETKRAFYAGAVAFQSLMFKTLSPGPLPTDGDMAAMNRIANELIEFGRDEGMDER